MEDREQSFLVKRESPVEGGKQGLISRGIYE